MTSQPANARAWQRPGWSSRTLGWLRDRLAERGEVLTSELTQVSTNDLSCVLRAGASGGGVYLKANESPYEALVTRRLARLRPASLPELLALDEAAGLLLTRDAGTHLAASDDLRAWEAAVTELALVHRAGAPGVLEGLGAPTQEHARLPARARELLLDRAALQGWGLQTEVVAGASALVPRLEAAHGRIAALGLTAGLAHGDAHPMNVLVGPRGVVLFDWHEAGWAHPFTDAGWFFAWLSHPARAGLPVRSAHPGAIERLWRLYLEAFGAPEAEELLEDAMMFALAHRAIVYHHRYVNWEGTVPGWRPQYTPYYLKWLCKQFARGAPGSS